MRRVKMETRHLIEGSFDSEYWEVCNHCIVMAAWSCKTFRFWEIVAFFLEKQPVMVKFSKFCSESFHCDTYCCVQILWNLADGYSLKSCVIYLAKKTECHLPLKLSLLRGSRPKCARASPQQCTQECSRFCPNRFTFSGVIAECMNTAKLPHKENPIFV